MSEHINVPFSNDEVNTYDQSNCLIEVNAFEPVSSNEIVSSNEPVSSNEQIQNIVNSNETVNSNELVNSNEQIQNIVNSIENIQMQVQDIISPVEQVQEVVNSVEQVQDVVSPTEPVQDVVCQASNYFLDNEDIKIMNVCPYFYNKGDNVWLYNSQNTNNWWYMPKYTNNIVQELYSGNEAGIVFNTYKFDFVNMTETHKYSNQSKKITFFIAKESNNINQIIFLYSTQKQYYNYNKESNEKLTHAFYNWLNGTSQHYCTFEINGCNYLFNFKTMEQFNLDTRRKRTMIIRNIVLEDIEGKNTSESENESESESDSKSDEIDKLEKDKQNYKCVIA